MTKTEKRTALEKIISDCELTDITLADLMMVSRSTVHRWRTGRIEMPMRELRNLRLLIETRGE